MLKTLLVTSLAVCSAPLAWSEQPATLDPWTKAPPLPTACYVGTDIAQEKLVAASEAVKAAMDHQVSLNDELKEKLNALDPMQQASLMQEYLMSHPEEGMKLMQANASVGATYSDDLAKSLETARTLESELTGSLAKYEAALEAVLGPIKAKFKDLDVRAKKDLVAVGETYTYAPWAIKEYDALNAQSNKGYETVCATWWATTGPFHAWMKKYKTFLIQEWLPPHVEAEQVAAGLQVVIAGTPEHPYLPTSSYQATIEYLKKATDLFGKRLREPGKNFQMF